MARSRVRKGLRGLLVVIAFFSMLLAIAETLMLLPTTWQHPLWQYFPFLLLAAAVIGVLISIRNKNTEWMDPVIRYWLCFELCLYGFAKIFGTQFDSPWYIRDSIVGSLNGFNLTWIYFGYSYSFAVIIAAVQIAGAVLLLFRRTTLLGALILLPVLFNIMMINFFYGIAIGALVNSVVFTIALIYLVYPHLNRLLNIVLTKQPSLHFPYADWIKPVLKIGTVATAFILIYQIRQNDPGDMACKWKVDKMIRSGDSVIVDEIMNWKNIYLEQNGDLAMCANPSGFDATRTIWGKYRYDKPGQQLRVLFEPGFLEPDSITISISRVDASRMNWSLIFQKQSILLQLSK